MEDRNQLIERARKQFETNKAPWDDLRTPPAIINVISPIMMDRDAAMLTASHVRIIRALVAGAIGSIERARVIFPLFNAGGVHDELLSLLEHLAGFYDPSGNPF